MLFFVLVMVFLICLILFFKGKSWGFCGVFKKVIRGEGVICYFVDIVIYLFWLFLLFRFEVD